MTNTRSCDDPQCGCGANPSLHARCAVITLSDTRTIAEDRSGDRIVELLRAAGHSVQSRDVLPDGAERLAGRLRELIDDSAIDAIITTGGTGIAPRDQTIEAVDSVLDVTLDGFGEHFRRVSFDEIGPKSMLSRAIAGRAGSTVVFALPGSTGAVATAMNSCVLPILPHAVSLARG